MEEKLKDLIARLESYAEGDMDLREINSLRVDLLNLAENMRKEIISKRSEIAAAP